MSVLVWPKNGFEESRCCFVLCFVSVGWLVVVVAAVVVVVVVMVSVCVCVCVCVLSLIHISEPTRPP